MCVRDYLGNSSVMDVIFECKIPQKNYSSYIIKKKVNAYYHSTHLAEGKGRTNIIRKNTFKPEKM